MCTTTMKWEEFPRRCADRMSLALSAAILLEASTTRSFGSLVLRGPSRLGLRYTSVPCDTVLRGDHLAASSSHGLDSLPLLPIKSSPIAVYLFL